MTAETGERVGKGSKGGQKLRREAKHELGPKVGSRRGIMGLGCVCGDPPCSSQALVASKETSTATSTNCKFTTLNLNIASGKMMFLLKWAESAAISTGGNRLQAAAGTGQAMGSPMWLLRVAMRWEDIAMVKVVNGMEEALEPVGGDLGGGCFGAREGVGAGTKRAMESQDTWREADHACRVCMGSRDSN